MPVQDLMLEHSSKGHWKQQNDVKGITPEKDEAAPSESHLD